MSAVRVRLPEQASSSSGVPGTSTCIPGTVSITWTSPGEWCVNPSLV